MTMEGNTMNERETAMIPYFAHEGEMSRAERANKRLWIIIIILIIALVGTNAGWIIYENSFETYYVEQDVQTDSGNSVVSGTGDAIYGNTYPSGSEIQGQEDEHQ